MTFAPPPAAPGPAPRPPRPTVVTAACVVMFGMAAIAALRQAISVVMSLGRITVVGIASAVLTLILAGVLAALAYFILQRANGARIGAWCLLGLMVVGGVCALGSFALAVSRGANLTGFTLAMTALSVLELAATIAAIALLALPASHAYFRSPQPGWPPQAGHGYVAPGPVAGYPGQPAGHWQRPNQPPHYPG